MSSFTILFWTITWTGIDNFGTRCVHGTWVSERSAVNHSCNVWERFIGQHEQNTSSLPPNISERMGVLKLRATAAISLPDLHWSSLPSAGVVVLHVVYRQNVYDHLTYLHELTQWHVLFYSRLDSLVRLPPRKDRLSSGGGYPAERMSQRSHTQG